MKHSPALPPSLAAVAALADMVAAVAHRCAGGGDANGQRARGFQVTVAGAGRFVGQDAADWASANLRRRLPQRRG